MARKPTYEALEQRVKIMKYISHSLFFLLTVFCVFTSPANSSERIIKVSLSKNPPLVFTDDKGEAQGIYIDVIKHIAREEEWTIQYVACKWHECQQKLQNGDIDLLMSIAYTEKRAQKFDFTEESVFNNWAYIYREPGSNIESIVDLEGQKVATVKDNIHSKGFVKALKSFNIQSEIIEVSDYPDVFRLIDEKKVSAGVVNRLNGLKYEAEFKPEKTR